MWQRPAELQDVCLLQLLQYCRLVLSDLEGPAQAVGMASVLADCIVHVYA